MLSKTFATGAAFLPINGNTIGCNSISNNALVFLPTEMLAPSSDAEEGEGSDTEAPNISSQQTEEALARRFLAQGA